MSAQAGWYPDPGGGHNLFRYWDGRTWSAATTTNPQAAPPAGGFGSPPPAPPYPPIGSGSNPYAPQSAGTHPLTPTAIPSPAPFGAAPTGPGTAYTGLPARKRSPIGWWLAAAALLVVIVVVAVIALRAVSGSGVTGVPTTAPSSDACPRPSAAEPSTSASPSADGRVHGGPLSFPELAAPWSRPKTDFRVPFGRDTLSQLVDVEPNYAPDANWVASVLVAELQAGDGFFTPQQGSQIVVRCILGAFYGDNPVDSDVKVNKAVTVDGHDGWLVESHLSFDIPGLEVKGELLIVAIVATGTTAGLFYASIPDSRPQLVRPARDSLAKLTVDG